VTSSINSCNSAAVVTQAVVNVRRITPERCSTTSNFSRAALRHVYVWRGELRSCVREGRGARHANTQQTMSKKGHEKVTMTKKRSPEF